MHLPWQQANKIKSTLEKCPNTLHANSFRKGSNTSVRIFTEISNETEHKQQHRHKQMQKAKAEEGERNKKNKSRIEM